MTEYQEGYHQGVHDYLFSTAHTPTDPSEFQDGYLQAVSDLNRAAAATAEANQ